MLFLKHTLVNVIVHQTSQQHPYCEGTASKKSPFNSSLLSRPFGVIETCCQAHFIFSSMLSLFVAMGTNVLT